MLQKLIKIAVILNLTQSFAAGSLYQIDLLVFSYSLNTTVSTFFEKQPQNNPGDISLGQIDSRISPYHLLPSHLSALKNESWTLSRKSGFQPLLNYTWLQPENNQKAILIDYAHNLAWNIKGAIRVRKNHYYLLDTNLYLQSPHASFSIIKKQRLKPNVVYFFDHPHAGMLIKIHQIT